MVRNRESKSRIVVTFILAITFSLVVTSHVSAATFSDVDSVPWAEEEIIFLHDERIINGLPDGSFGVSDHISRADAALMLARANHLQDDNVLEESPFSDVDESAYYYEGLQFAVHAGYMIGYPDGSFGPQDPLTREQMAKIIAEAYDLEGVSGDYFTDVSSSWAEEYINSLAVNGISNGTADGTFHPSENISRAEFAVMLARAMNDDFKLEPAEVEVGTSRTNPAGTGEVITVEKDDWLNGYQKYEVELLDTISGDEAWEIVSDANPFNNAPNSGMKYVLAKFRVKVLELENEPFQINHAKFDAVSQEGVKYEQFISISGLSPELRTDIYEGGEHEGWTYFMVHEDDAPFVVFNQNWDDEVWFDLSK
ncbi:S-layer homology domain-containing protein [Oceanobacillus senegalensis]|uniref:S-layer homology domain-containing protein n=1 Tax=Oceanobacillus senegalensis TaxID=1936063 RepID=UPI0015C42238|nr:S-layer homology domain-containing protein [Oceanobacillus senegalensis]